MEAIVKQFHSEVSPIPFLIVPLPTSNYLYEQCKPNYIDRFDSLGLNSQNVHVFNLTSELMSMSMDARHKLFFKCDSHFSVYGHQVIADLVSAEIIQILKLS